MRLATIGLCLIATLGFAGDQRWSIVPEEVEAGRRLGSGGPGRSIDDLFEVRAPRRAVDEVFWNSRVSIGSWFNGNRMRPVEWAMHLDNRLFSRWLGFLEAREHWDAEEFEYRWNELQNLYGSGDWFLVQLASFPKQQVFDTEPYRRPDLTELTNVRVVATDATGPLPTDHYSAGLIRRRTLGEVEEYPWQFHLPLAELLIWEFQNPPTARASLGEYALAWHLVHVPQAEPGTKVTIRILSHRKERAATFTIGQIPVQSKNQ